MHATKLSLKGLFIIKPNVINDDRGFFYESFQQQKFNSIIGENINFVQDNHASSQKAVARGLHFQMPPHEQGKLVRVIKGQVFDVALDIREKSPTFGQWHGVILSEHNKLQFWIPKGFAHGYIALQDNTEFLYKTDNFYNPQYESAILFNDTELNINLPNQCSISMKNIILSQKDKIAKPFKDAILNKNTQN